LIENMIFNYIEGKEIPKLEIEKYRVNEEQIEE
jgi:Mor family transcriptional regulator